MDEDHAMGDSNTTNPHTATFGTAGSTTVPAPAEAERGGSWPSEAAPAPGQLTRDQRRVARARSPAVSG